MINVKAFRAGKPLADGDQYVSNLDSRYEKVLDANHRYLDHPSQNSSQISVVCEQREQIEHCNNIVYEFKTKLKKANDDNKLLKEALRAHLKIIDGVYAE
tara:strand:+ start:43 stop:342 length:300 start_codon:yes stop_codon:yes gene_type:complete